MKNIKWLRSVAFLTLLALAVVGVMNCYGLPKTYVTRSLAAFDAEDENLIDGVVMGTSVVGYSWTTPAVWRDYGLSIYQVASNSQAFGVIPEYLDYVRESHDIKFAVIDIHGLRSAAIKTSIQKEAFRSAYLNIPNLKHRYKILLSLFDFAEKAFEAYNISNEDDSKYIKLHDKSYYIPFLNFHGRWVDGLKKADYVTVANKYMGANDRSNSFGVMDCTPYLENWDFEILDDINDFQKEQLQKVFDYGKENNIEFLFINLPSFRSKDEQQEMSTILEYCRQQGYNTIDFSSEEMLKKTGIDLTKDFVNKGHLNSSGGVKSTKFICEYLMENGYYTPDHRGEPGYESWDKATEAYFKFYDKGWKK